MDEAERRKLKDKTRAARAARAAALAGLSGLDDTARATGLVAANKSYDAAMAAAYAEHPVYKIPKASTAVRRMNRQPPACHDAPENTDSQILAANDFGTSVRLRSTLGQVVTVPRRPEAN